MTTAHRILLGVLLSQSLFISPAQTASTGIEPITTNLTFVHGPVNGVRVEANGKTLAIYGDPRENPPPANRVLLPHVRRDTAWAARKLIQDGATAVVPEKEALNFTKPEEFWLKFEQTRFHNYYQFSTKVLPESLAEASAVVPVKPGDKLDWEGFHIQVLGTPGYSPGSVTYLISAAGKRVAFSGDLIYGDGKILDLYSFQDAIPEAKIGGYHGYAARLGDLVQSLRVLEGEKPDLIIPARGPVIENPSVAIKLLLQRVQAVYSNYLSIDALRWYFGDPHIMAKASRVLGLGLTIDWMPMAETNALPSWVKAIDNARLIRSKDGAGLLVDCGGAGILNEVKKLRDAGSLSSLDYIFISHYHDDHTDQVPAAVEAFGSTVLACRELCEILENPSAFSLPCLTRNPITVAGRLDSGASWRWKEFELTAYYFPGQTLYHQGLLVRKEGGESIFFIGDSFTPSGIDDYCLQNRNFLHPDSGFFKCLKMVKQLPPGTWLVNQHVDPMFRYTPAQIERMQSTLEQRVELLRALFPWDDINYGLDEMWARFAPYAIEVESDKHVACRAVVLNHSPKSGSFQVRPHLPKGWQLKSALPHPVLIPPQQEGVFEFQVLPPAKCAEGPFIMSADVLSEQGEFKEWIEASIRVRRAN